MRKILTILSILFSLNGFSQSSGVTFDWRDSSLWVKKVTANGGGVARTFNFKPVFSGQVGSGLPGGSNTQLQYNNSSAFGGITGATTNGTVVTLTSPVLITPVLGTPSSGTVTNLTGTASININGTVGATTPAVGTFTTLTATSNVGFTGSAAIVTIGGGATAAEVRYLEPSGSGVNYSAFKAVAQSANITYSLPPTVGAAGTVLTDAAGNGVLSWASGAGGSPVGNYGNVQLNRGGSFATPGSDSLNFLSGLYVKGVIHSSSTIFADGGGVVFIGGASNSELLESPTGVLNFIRSDLGDWTNAKLKNLTATGTGDFTGAISIGNTVNAVSPTSPNRTITIVIGGVTYYIPCKTTND